jgi:hypothetical protein
MTSNHLGGAAGSPWASNEIWRWSAVPDRTHPTLRQLHTALSRRSTYDTGPTQQVDGGPSTRRTPVRGSSGVLSRPSSAGGSPTSKMLERVSGKRRMDGLWARHRQDPRSVRTRTLTLSWLGPGGRCSRKNAEFVSPRVLRHSGWPSSLRDDRARPTPCGSRCHAKYHVPRAGPIRPCRFNEAVNGITDNSVTVRPIEDFDSTPPEPVIPVGGAGVQERVWKR